MKKTRNCELKIIFDSRFYLYEKWNVNIDMSWIAICIQVRGKMFNHIFMIFSGPKIGRRLYKGGGGTPQLIAN